MTTIKDVARVASVSISTASNALNGKYGVHPATRERIVEIAKQLNYTPNSIAQGLVTNCSKNISIVISGPSSFKLFTNPAFIEVVQSITIKLNENGYQALLNIVDMGKEEEMIPRIVQSRATDAMILIDTRTSDMKLAQVLKEVKIPALSVIRRSPCNNVFSVSVDNHQCGYLATKHLIDMGHRYIGYIGSLPGVSLAQQRFEGYRQALAENHLVAEDLLVVDGDYYQETGLTGIRKLLRQSSKRPTGVFIANDLMALGALEALQQEGLRVPEDISIVGCDNIPNLHLLRVPLTTISIPFGEIGRFAAEKIIGILEHHDQLEPHVVLAPELRIRSSVKQID